VRKAAPQASNRCYQSPSWPASSRNLQFRCRISPVRPGPQSLFTHTAQTSNPRHSFKINFSLSFSFTLLSASLLCAPPLPLGEAAQLRIVAFFRSSDVGRMSCPALCTPRVCDFQWPDTCAHLPPFTFLFQSPYCSYNTLAGVLELHSNS
jgi:hypothetical protein